MAIQYIWSNRANRSWDCQWEILQEWLGIRRILWLLRWSIFAGTDYRVENEEYLKICSKMTITPNFYIFIKIFFSKEGIKIFFHLKMNTVELFYRKVNNSETKIIRYKDIVFNQRYVIFDEISVKSFKTQLQLAQIQWNQYETIRQSVGFFSQVRFFECSYFEIKTVNQRRVFWQCQDVN